MRYMDKKTFDEQYERAVERGKLARQTEPRATSATYDARTDRLTVELSNGAVFIVPRGLIQGLQAASPEQIAAVKVMPRGAALHWEELDVQMGVPQLVSGVFGTRAWMSELARLGGSATTEKKAVAARANGAKGGRPARVRRA
jgi:hypothetical protein